MGDDYKEVERGYSKISKWLPKESESWEAARSPEKA